MDIGIVTMKRLRKIWKSTRRVNDRQSERGYDGSSIILKSEETYCDFEIVIKAID